MRQINLETSGQPREAIEKCLDIAQLSNFVVKTKINGVPMTVRPKDSVDWKMNEYKHKRRNQLNGGWYTKYKLVLLGFVFLIIIFLIIIIGVTLWT